MDTFAGTDVLSTGVRKWLPAIVSELVLFLVMECVSQEVWQILYKSCLTYKQADKNFRTARDA